MTSLRSALTRWFTGASTLTLLVLGTVLLVAVRQVARSAEDQRLASAADQVIASLLARAPETWSADSLRASLPADEHDGFGALRAESGEVLAAWNVRAREHLPPLVHGVAPGPLLATYETLEVERTLALADHAANTRIVTVPFRRQDQLFFLQLGHDRRWTTRIEVGLVIVLALGAVVLALASRLAARRVIGRVLSPLGALAEDARKLSPSNPGGRVRLPARDVELQRLEEELNAALQRMEEGFRGQAQFTSNVAHELRTPIAALMVDAQVSRLGCRSLEKSYAFVDHAEVELRHMSDLVETFLAMARVDARQKHEDLVYFDDVIRRGKRRCAAAAAEHEVEIVVQLDAPETNDPFVLGDAQLLQVMLENLLRNAIDHSPRGAAVTVSTRCSAGVLHLMVSDRGPGIPEKLRQAVFVRGFRGPEERSTSGTGLGLAIVSSVARLHGGSVDLETDEGFGSTFVVTLPLAHSSFHHAVHDES